MPAVNWVERGLNGDGNSYPRYHCWGYVTPYDFDFNRSAKNAGKNGRLTILHECRVTELLNENGRAVGAVAVKEKTGEELRFSAKHVVLAMVASTAAPKKCAKLAQRARYSSYLFKWRTSLCRWQITPFNRRKI